MHIYICICLYAYIYKHITHIIVRAHHKQTHSKPISYRVGARRIWWPWWKCQVRNTFTHTHPQTHTISVCLCLSLAPGFCPTNSLSPARAMLTFLALFLSFSLSLSRCLSPSLLPSLSLPLSLFRSLVLSLVLSCCLSLPCLLCFPHEKHQHLVLLHI